MATQFLSAPAIRRHAFTQYSSTLSAFQTAYQADIPELAAVQALATTAAPTIAIIITPNGGPVLSVSPGQWLGYNYGNWTVVPVASMGRIVTDLATTSASAVVTSATAAFVAGDVGAYVSTLNLPVSTKVVTVTNSTTVTVSAAATATSSAQNATITPVTALYTPDIV